MSATDSVDEKAPAVVQKRGFFSRKQKVEKDSDSETTQVEQPAAPQTPPISILQLFRFSTKFELTLDAIGLVAAAAAGAAQVGTQFNPRRHG